MAMSAFRKSIEVMWHPTGCLSTQLLCKLLPATSAHSGEFNVERLKEASMNIRAMIGVFVSVLILAGCAAPAPPAPSTIPTSLPIATWVAQGIPSDLRIQYSYGSRWDRGDELQIRADGTAEYLHWSADGHESTMFAGKLSPDVLRRAILAFEETRFFYLTVDGGCIVDIASPPTSKNRRQQGYVTDQPRLDVSIRINGISKTLTRDEGYSCSGISNIGNANLSSLAGRLRALGTGLPPWTSGGTGAAQPDLSATPTEPAMP
jgi:hypothetical protein